MMYSVVLRDKQWFRPFCYLTFICLMVLCHYGCSNKSKGTFPFIKSGSDYFLDDKNSPFYGASIRVNGKRPDSLSFYISTIEEIPTLPYESIIPLGSAFNLHSNKENITFQESITVTIPIKSDINSIVFIGYYNENQKKWEYIPPDTTNTSENTIAFRTNHLSVFVPIIFEKGNFSDIYEEIQADIEFQKLIRNTTKMKLSAKQIVDIKTECVRLENYYLDKMVEMTENYQDCKSRVSCDVVYSEFPDFIHQQFIASASQQILTGALLKGASVAIVKSAFVVGSVITGLVLVDCLACFLPNSIVSTEWWSSLFKYHFIKMLNESLQIYDTISDIDGNIYFIEEIGDQLWMGQNLATTRLNDGTVIKMVEEDKEWSEISLPAYCWYDNDINEYKDIYGALYNDYAAASEKICPVGWHVPTDEEWMQLESHSGIKEEELPLEGWRGEYIGKSLHETELDYWDISRKSFNNMNMFSGSFAGSRFDGFNDFGKWGMWWSSTKYVSQLMSRGLNIDTDGIYRWRFSSSRGYSIRCVKDEVDSLELLYPSIVKNVGFFEDPRDGEKYKLLQIKDQIWMSENLRYKPKEGNFSSLNKDESNIAVLGYLYDYPTACAVCPDGWHLPSDEEWLVLERNVGITLEESDYKEWRGDEIGNKFKSIDGWADKSGTNSFGFSVHPGGARLNSRQYTGIGEEAFFWTSTKGGYENEAYFRRWSYMVDGVARYYFPIHYQFSVRCIKDSVRTGAH